MALLDIQKQMIEDAKKHVGRLDSIFRVAVLMGDDDTAEYIVKTQIEHLSTELRDAMVQAGIIVPQ